jgi:hypothetical protein
MSAGAVRPRPTISPGCHSVSACRLVGQGCLRLTGLEISDTINAPTKGGRWLPGIASSRGDTR